jgi:hypothetical protein
MLLELSLAIQNNESPVIVACSFSVKDVYTMGMVEQLSWADKTYEHDDEGEVCDVIWHYCGPNSIRLDVHGMEELITLRDGDSY